LRRLPVEKFFGQLARRLSWNILDQVISSVTNAGLSVAVAKSVNAEQFGAFAVAFTVYSVVVLASRGLTGQPLSIRFSAAPESEYGEAGRASLGATVMFGLVAGATSLLSGLVISGPVGGALVAVGIGLPALLWQDSWRMVFFGQLNPRAATINDATWAGTQILAIGGLLLLGIRTAPALLLAWSGSAGVAALVGIAQTGWLPSFRTGWGYTRRHWDITKYLVGELLISQGGLQGGLLAVGVLGTVSDVGSLRAAMVILGPVAILSGSMSAFAVPELARRSTMSAPNRIRVCYLTSLTLMLFSVLWATGLHALPDAVGQFILGDTWAGTQRVLLPQLAQQVGLLISVGPTIMCYALGRTKETFQINVVLSVLTVSGGTVGVMLGGAPGAGIGFACAAWLSSPLWWRKVLMLVRLPPLDEATEATRQAA